MSIRITIVGDTHAFSFEDIPHQIIESCQNSDWIIHVGDYISEDILNGFFKLKKEYFKGVYGNADPLSIRNMVLAKEVIEISNIKMGIIHPYYGGPDSSLLRKIIKEFKEDKVKVIFFGHTHDPKILVRKQLLLINPGKGYIDSNSINSQASIAILEIGSHLNASIRQINF